MAAACPTLSRTGYYSNPTVVTGIAMELGRRTGQAVPAPDPCTKAALDQWRRLEPRRRRRVRAGAALAAAAGLFVQYVLLAASAGLTRLL